MTTTEQIATINQSKQILIDLHTEWLHQTDSDELYQRPTHVERMNIVLNFTESLRGNILDVGCYDGYFSKMILQQGGKTIYGMDRLPEALLLAEKRGIHPVLGDLDSGHVDFPDHYFDGVIMGGVLHYTFDPDLVIAEMKRILKPGGALIITVPNLTSLDNRIRVLFGHPPLALDVRPSQGGYWRYFTFDTLRELLTDHQFQVERLESNVCILPIFLAPGLRRFFSSYRWERHRIFASRQLSRLFPQLGEQIIALAYNR